ncbi:MAG: glycosyltransferase family 4 protein [Candidatus Jordarchaeaceae archaeon]
MFLNYNIPIVLYLMRFYSLKRGSFERFLIALSEKAKSQYAFVFVFGQDPPAWLKEVLINSGARVDSICMKRNRIGFSGLNRLIKRYKPDIIHLHFFSLLHPFIPYLRWWHGVKIVHHIHNFEVKRTGISGFFIPLRKYVAVKSIHRALCVSEFVKKKTASQFHFKEKQLISVLNGVEQPNLNGYAEDIRLSLGISKDSLIIFSAAWLHENKGLHFLIQSLPNVHKEVREKVFTIIAGDGPELPRLKSLAESLGIREKVIFLGWRNDVPQLLSQSDIVVVPSIWEEPCGYIVLEALAAGKPVIGSDTGGITELLSGDPPAGILVPPSDANALSNAIKDLILDREKRENLSAEARKRTLSSFHISRQIDQIVRIYTDLLS